MWCCNCLNTEQMVVLSSSYGFREVWNGLFTQRWRSFSSGSHVRKLQICSHVNVA